LLARNNSTSVLTALKYLNIGDSPAAPQGTSLAVPAAHPAAQPGTTTSTPNVAAAANASSAPVASPAMAQSVDAQVEARRLAERTAPIAAAGDSPEREASNAAHELTDAVDAHLLDILAYGRLHMASRRR